MSQNADTQQQSDSTNAEEVSAQSAFTEKASRRDWIAVAGMVLGAFVAILDIQIINSSLADIQGSLSASLSEGSWISTSYMIAEIVVIPLSAWLATVFSMRRYLLWSTAAFILTSSLCGMAWSLESMILFRALQGVAVAPLIPLSFTLIRTRLPESQQPIGMALFSFSAVLAPSIGPTIGGWLTENFSWHLIFYLNFLPGLLMMALLAHGLDSEPMRLDRLRNADWPGIASLSVGLATLEFVLEEGNRNNWFESHEITLFAFIATISLTSFVYLQLTRKDPLLNLRILGEKQFLLGTLANCAMGLALYGSVFLLPMYLASIQNYSPMEIGEVMLWVGVPQLFLIPLLPVAMKYFETRWLCIFGLMMFAISALMNSYMSYDFAGDQFRLSLIIRAIGQPFVMVPLSVLATAKLDLKDIPSASSVYNTTRNLSGAVGIAMLSTIIDRRSTFHQVRIGETLSLYDQKTQIYLDKLQSILPQLTPQQDLALIMKQIARDAGIMAFSDSFIVIAGSLVIGVLAVIAIGSNSTQSVQATS
ncbi:DHA2 family efflux MFS transporter permease subunit [Sansalvadorimonas sp. 2012CJ34-2]|uniref:DHA2 family efflux MFS transporter permease subunit n=1 Tax=Parendozoicomonas callyspongiae TaxID=2942213 RepID=A0ABT0PJE8_9GAMM|nr:DHA2 family efflux MFS transporter permease subunit [Sansalvadorimonas sp. 2012CJ34-2]MCL6271520.1 DHA2 family efflux MFS transporter permease subunit [Sansalvadorimonas sp. 2012CJ34-2]